MRWRNIFVLFLLFVYSSVSAETVFRNIDWESIDNNLNTIEQSLNLLQTENNNLQLQLTNAGEALNEQVKFSANQSIQLQSYVNKSARLEKHIRIYRIALLIATTGFITTTTILLIRD